MAINGGVLIREIRQAFYEPLVAIYQQQKAPLIELFLFTGFIV